MTPMSGGILAEFDKEIINPEILAAVEEVIRMLLIGHASRGEKVLPAIKMKVTGYWVKEVIRIEIK